MTFMTMPVEPTSAGITTQVSFASLSATLSLTPLFLRVSLFLHGTAPCSRCAVALHVKACEGIRTAVCIVSSITHGRSFAEWPSAPCTNPTHCRYQRHCHYIIQVLSSYCHGINPGVLEWWARHRHKFAVYL